MRGVENVIAAIILISIALAASSIFYFIITSAVSRPHGGYLAVSISDARVAITSSGSVVMIAASIQAIGYSANISEVSLYVEGYKHSCSVYPDIVGSYISPGLVYTASIICPVSLAGVSYLSIKYCLATGECSGYAKLLGRI